MKYNVISRQELCFYVGERTHTIRFTHFKLEDGYEGLLEISRIECLDMAGKPWFEYYWGSSWLPYEEYSRKKLDMDFIEKDCIANIFCEDHKLSWNHD